MSYRACNKCGWVHFPRTLTQVIAEVEQFNAYYADLSPEQQESYYGSRPSTIENYTQCFRCGNPHHDFSVAISVPHGSTIQPILCMLLDEVDDEDVL